MKDNLFLEYLITLLQSVLSFSGLIYALLFRNLVDSALSDSGFSMKHYFLCFLFVLLVQSILSALLRRLKEIAQVNTENILKKNIFQIILEGDYSYVTGIHSGEWMNKTTNDVSVVAGNAVNLLPNAVSVVIQIIGSAVFLAVLEPSFVFYIIFSILVVFVFDLVFYKRIKALHKDVQKSDGVVRSYIQECISSLIVIKSYVKEGVYFRNLRQFLEQYKSSRLKKNAFSVLMNFFFGFGINGILILSAIFCAHGIVNGRISYGTFVAVIQVVSQLRTPLANAYISIPNYYSMIGSIERLMEIEEAMPAQAEPCSFEGDNEFESINASNISFSYLDEEQTRHVIRNLSFSINNGEFVVVTGPSGCGKSTLLKVLLGLYHIDEGELVVNTKNGDVSRNTRGLFAYVPQANVLMNGSIKDAICFGDLYDQDKMEKSIAVSCSDDFIFDLPKGIETILGEKGNGLSDGQMQRIAIARALYSDHSVLLLDEATNALNEDLELKVMMNLKKLTNKTIVLITHRKKILEFADKVLECREKNGEYIWTTKQD